MGIEQHNVRNTHVCSNVSLFSSVWIAPNKILVLNIMQEINIVLERIKCMKKVKIFPYFFAKEEEKLCGVGGSMGRNPWWIRRCSKVAMHRCSLKREQALVVRQNSPCR
jgi:hypothetical protein